jgi:predicted nicotinamide N-methyase
MSATYETKLEEIAVGGQTLRIRSLKDRNQYWDPQGTAEAAGFGSANWSLFGNLWPSARVLAAIAQTIDVRGRRVLEVGAGLGLASLVLARRGADVTASDSHPLAGEFLAENARLNGLPPVKFALADWAKDDSPFGDALFDLILGSDVLYDHGMAASLSAFIARASAPEVEIIIIDPNRGHRTRFTRAMQERGFTVVDEKAPDHLEGGEAFKGHVLTLRRAG